MVIHPVNFYIEINKEIRSPQLIERVSNEGLQFSERVYIERTSIIALTQKIKFRQFEEPAYLMVVI